MTTHGLQRYVDDLLRGRRPDAILSHSTFLTDRTGPRPSAAHRTETVARLGVRAVTAPSKSRPSPADLTSPSAATRVTRLPILWRALRTCGLVAHELALASGQQLVVSGQCGDGSVLAAPRATSGSAHGQ